ncbi:MAG: ribosome-associated translation inhibitor RaiA [Candidatus Pacebacteria bacterium]|nr:ribosome-associated translation inhibitor RaiA [Candidatus Paceibacterota bacterium]
MDNNIKINSIDVEITEELRVYINKKLKRIKKFIDFNDPSVSADIRLIKDSKGQSTGKFYRVELSIMTAGKKYGVNASGNSPYQAIDQVKDLIFRKISEHKDKKQNLFKKGGAKIKSFLKKFNK